MTTALNLVHIRFDAVALTPMRLGGYQAGERLRDALAQVMLRSVCPEVQRPVRPSAEHTAVCPVCWLLAYQGRQAGQAQPAAAAVSSDVAGEVRRAYGLIPPLPVVDVLQPGQAFSFTLTLYGDGYARFFPYFVLAVSEAGQVGVGPGRGRFAVQAIWAADGQSACPIYTPAPQADAFEAVLRPGEALIRLPQRRLDWDAVQRQAAVHSPALERSHNLAIEFLTPTRLVMDEALVKAPDFGVFFRRLLERIDDLGQQFAGQARRPAEQVQALYQQADQVRLVQADTQWVELWGPSGRTGRRTPMGGFVGRARYRSAEWGPLLPWLLLGQALQVGKLSSKGNGVFQLLLPGTAGYWVES